LVAIIEPTPRGISVDEGPAARPDRLAKSVCDYYGFHVDIFVGQPDIGPQVPPELMRCMTDRVASLVEDLTTKFRSYGGEETSTGAVISKLEGYTDSVGGWTVRVRLQKFAPNPKEKRVGADIGIILDLSRGQDRVVKAMLVQAKWTDELPSDITKLDKLPGQLQSMRKHTDECYALIYTPNDVYVFRWDDTRHHIELPAFVKEGVVCRRGDRAPNVIAQALDRDYVILAEARQ
jgi:hypothetical protein